jgi:hypothetical protein
MLRTGVCLAAMLLVAGSLQLASAQTTTAPAASTPAATAPASGDAKPKLTKMKLKEMMANWRANKPKLTACKKEVKAKGLVGDDRWFYISDCMNKT